MISVTVEILGDIADRAIDHYDEITIFVLHRLIGELSEYFKIFIGEAGNDMLLLLMLLL